MNKQKIIQLEEKISLLEYHHDKLDKVVIAQQEQIGFLEKAFKQIDKKLATQFENSIVDNNEPPHY